MAAKSSPRKRMKRRKPTAVEQEAPRFASPQTPTSLSPATPPPTDSRSLETHQTPTKGSASETHQQDDGSAPPVPACILPPHLAYLKDRYSLATMSVISSSKIEQKVKTLLKHLERFSYGKIDAKPGLVALHAKAPVANKMVSIIDIATRTAVGGKLYQYSRVSGELMALKAKGGGRKDETAPPAEDEEGDDMDEAFETMAVLSRPKVRAVPVLTVYLARVPVAELATEFGQQTIG